MEEQDYTYISHMHKIIFFINNFYVSQGLYAVCSMIGCCDCYFPIVHLNNFFLNFA